jgi:hypothetical protein
MGRRRIYESDSARVLAYQVRRRAAAAAELAGLRDALAAAEARAAPRPEPEARRLQERIARLEAANAKLKAVNARLNTVIADLKAIHKVELADLKRSIEARHEAKLARLRSRRRSA